MRYLRRSVSPQTMRTRSLSSAILLFAVLLMAIALLTASCSDAGSSTPGEGEGEGQPLCVPGSTQICDCTPSIRGVQTCNAAGSGYGPCGQCEAGEGEGEGGQEGEGEGEGGMEGEGEGGGQEGEGEECAGDPPHAELQDGVCAGLLQVCIPDEGAGWREPEPNEIAEQIPDYEPDESSCDGQDNDCNGQVDEGLSRSCNSACGNGTETCFIGSWVNCTAPQPNACGGCGALPAETCNGRDDDCDGQVDEGLSRVCNSACGDGTESCNNGSWVGCTAPPVNACGGCGAAPAEVCDGQDNDCDGQVDEGIAPRACQTACGNGTESCRNGSWVNCSAPRPNACGQCGPLPAEICNGRDDDCDGHVDVGATCPAGQRCVNGACEQLGGPADACATDDDCAGGICNPDLPGGFCVMTCRGDADCAGGTCIDNGGDPVCLDTCNAGLACRAGWVCYDPGQCWPACNGPEDCNEGTQCNRASGFCEYLLYTIILEEVVLRPYIYADGSKWDGFGSASPDLISAVSDALLGASPYGAVVGVLANLAAAGADAPDANGTAELLFGADPYPVQLPEVGNEYRPRWGATWNGIPLTAGVDVRLRVSLTDADLEYDDQIGTATATLDDLVAAAASGGEYAVDTSATPPGNNILFLVVQVIPEN